MKEFQRTMKGVIADTEHMFAKEILTPEELLVIVISDGLDRLNIPEFLEHMQHIDTYDETRLQE